MVKIEIGFNENGAYVNSSLNKYDTPIALEGEYQDAFDIVKHMLNDSSNLYAVQRSDNYVTLLLTKDGDFFRMHFGERAKWFSVSITGNNIKLFKDDQRLACVKNKNQIHWKIKIDNVQDINKFEDVILAAAQSRLEELK
jgi:hypothetical protein